MVEVVLEAAKRSVYVLKVHRGASMDNSRGQPGVGGVRVSGA